MDDFLRIGSSFDWITPALAMVKDVVNRPSHTFLIPQDCGFSGREIARYLRRHGVKTWGLMIVNHTIMLTVRMQQARYAQCLLDRAGVRLEGGAVPTSARSSRARGASSRTTTKPAQRKRRQRSRPVR